MRKLATFLVVLAFGGLAAGCGSDDDGRARRRRPPRPRRRRTARRRASRRVTDGRLTIGTDNPAFPPWFEGGTPEGSDWEINDPASGEGFESAVAFAVAEQLGFAEDEVDWVVVPFNNSFRPGDKNFDLDINQISVTDERRPRSRLQRLLLRRQPGARRLAGTPIANATTLADLADYQLGAQVGTTSCSTSRNDPALEGAARLRHVERRRLRTERQADRRHRRRPADRVLPRRLR